MIVYIAGPMSASERSDYNRPAFHATADMLKRGGHIALNPAILPDGLTHEQYMIICLAMVDVADAIYMMDGWENSKGAKIELLRAVERGKTVMG